LNISDELLGRLVGRREKVDLCDLGPLVHDPHGFDSRESAEFVLENADVHHADESSRARWIILVFSAEFESQLAIGGETVRFPNLISTRLIGECGGGGGTGPNH
jgi:hypothetical protein